MRVSGSNPNREAFVTSVLLISKLATVDGEQKVEL